MERIHFENFMLAGFTYYDGTLVYEKFNIGTELKMITEPQNPHDKNSVAFYFGKHKLGYIPRYKNRNIAAILNAGYDILEARIQQLHPDAHPEEQIGVVVYIKEKTKP